MIVASQPVSRAEVARHYDELDGFYRELWGEHLHHGLWQDRGETPEEAVRNLVHLVARCADLEEGERVCDVGCGYGATARMLTAEHGVRVTGITISRSQYDYAVARGGDPEDPSYVVGDWLENDLPSAGFDAVVAIESVGHMEDRIGCFVEAHRVLRPGGRLVVCAWLAGSAAPWQRSLLLEPICDEGRLPGLATRDEYRGWMAAAGLEAGVDRDLTDGVRRTWSICLGRAFRALASRPRYLRYLLDRSSRERRFLLAMARIWLAYRTGAMRYAVFTARKASK